MDDQIISEAEKFARHILENEGTGHDWWHIERVRHNARAICRTEKADSFVVDLSLILHDVGDWKVVGKNEDDYSIAESFLKRMRLAADIRRQVMFIIRNMSFGSSLRNSRKKMSIEFRIAQDADRLDAMGAIGIARCFAFGGSRSRPLYNPEERFVPLRTKKDYIQKKSSSLNHFYEKLFLLKNLMNTKSARKIAVARHRFMKKFERQFLTEWDGRA